MMTMQLMQLSLIFSGTYATLRRNDAPGLAGNVAPVLAGARHNTKAPLSPFLAASRFCT
jgi:hypothetical protein